MASANQTSSAEQVVWTGHPSQVKNLGWYLLCLLLSPLVVPIFFGLWKWLDLRCHTYELTSQRLRTRRGILSKQTDELELYRVKDIRLAEPFWMRMFSLGNLVLLTSDRTSPELMIEAIHEPESVRDQIRGLVEALRDTKRVREIDFE